jgi:TPR repeat protein
MKKEFIKAIRTATAALCVAAGCFSTATAQQFDPLAYMGPESQARPGEVYFHEGVEAIRHKDYPFAVQRYLAAASWAYKDAEYNLSVMYLHGEGVPMDRPRAMAWMALAAERGDKKYVEAREVIYADLTTEEFAKANEIYREIKPEYGDEVALHRAKAKWVETRQEATGSHLGFVGNLAVGLPGDGTPTSLVPQLVGGKKSGDKSKALNATIKGGADGFATAAFGITGGNQVDGSTAYRGLQETDNPYDPRFQQGVATVGPLQQVPKKETDATPTSVPVDVGKNQ